MAVVCNERAGQGHRSANSSQPPPSTMRSPMLAVALAAALAAGTAAAAGTCPPCEAWESKTCDEWGEVSNGERAASSAPRSSSLAVHRLTRPTTRHRHVRAADHRRLRLLGVHVRHSLADVHPHGCAEPVADHLRAADHLGCAHEPPHTGANAVSGASNLQAVSFSRRIVNPTTPAHPCARASNPRRSPR